MLNHDRKRRTTNRFDNRAMLRSNASIVLFIFETLYTKHST